MGGKEGFDGAIPSSPRPVHRQGRRRGQARAGSGTGREVAWSVASAGRAAVTLLGQPGPSAGAAAQYVFQGAVLLAEQLVDLVLLVLR